MAEFRAAATDRASLMAALRARIDEIRITHADLDAMVGWASGLSGKLFGPATVKSLGMDNFLLLLEALALRIELVQDVDAAKRMEGRWERWNVGKRTDMLRRPNRVARIGKHIAKRMAKQLGKRGGHARMTTLSAAKRIEVARIAGIASGAARRAARRLVQAQSKPVKSVENAGIPAQT